MSIAMDSTRIEVPIFTDTNLGTHFALSVPPDIAARDFKKQLETAHLKCFPESKEIEVYGLMVKRKSRFYHLPDSVPIKLAFEGVTGAWFIRVQARASAQCLDGDHDDDDDQGERRTSPMFSQVKSVSSIIGRYFPSPTASSDAVTSKKRKKTNRMSGRRRSRRPRVFLLPNTPSDCAPEKAGAEVGKRLVAATNNLGIFSSTKRSAPSSGRASCLIQRSVFEISGSDDD